VSKEDHRFDVPFLLSRKALILDLILLLLLSFFYNVETAKKKKPQ
jgi:hypothetical protein